MMTLTQKRAIVLRVKTGELSLERAAKQFGVRPEEIQKWIDTLFYRKSVGKASTKQKPSRAAVTPTTTARIDAYGIDAIKALISEGFQNKEIAEDIGVSESALSLYLRTRGVRRYGARRNASRAVLLNVGRLEICDLLQRGLSLNEIAKGLQVGLPALQAFMKE